MIELGKRARDKVTGFKGVITGRSQFITGCDQYVLIPKMKKGDTELAKGQWFDEGRLEVIGDGIAVEDVMAEKPGGPQRDQMET